MVRDWFSAPLDATPDTREMISQEQLRGCHVALITPMTPIGGLRVIDYQKLYERIDACLEAGVSGVLFAGTTGQSATLSHDEQIELCTRGIDYARRRAADLGRPVTCLASAGSNATDEALYMSENIVEAIRPDALLHVTGYYNNPPQEGLRAHFEKIGDLLESLDTSLVLYNIPGRTGSRIEVDALVRLAEHPAIAAVKEATGDLESIERLVERVDPSRFAVLSGEDHLVAPIIRRGGVGVISASANRWPREFQRVAELALSGDWEAADALQAALQPCVDAVFSVKNPIPLHHMLGAGLRLPLLAVDELDPPNRDAALAKIRAAEAIREFPTTTTAGAV